VKYQHTNGFTVYYGYPFRHGRVIAACSICGNFKWTPHLLGYAFRFGWTRGRPQTALG